MSELGLAYPFKHLADTDLWHTRIISTEDQHGWEASRLFVSQVNLTLWYSITLSPGTCDLVIIVQGAPAREDELHKADPWLT